MSFLRPDVGNAASRCILKTCVTWDIGPWINRSYDQALSIIARV
jgi:hypothetical protein